MLSVLFAGGRMRLNGRIAVLYAEDNEDSGFMLKTLLEFSGIDVLLARSVKEAFQSVQNGFLICICLTADFPTGADLSCVNDCMNSTRKCR